MSESETQTQSLLDGPSQETAINVGVPAQSGRSTRAYKVAGLTLLACCLIMSQALIGYFLLSQRSDIKSLEEQGNKMNEQLTKGRSASVQMRAQKPMNILPVWTDVDMEASTGATDKVVPLQGTQCQLEAAGMKPMVVPDFRPACDEQGLYKAQQCFMYNCWCVYPADGQQIPGSLRSGRATCGTSVSAGGLHKPLTMADIEDV